MPIRRPIAELEYPLSLRRLTSATSAARFSARAFDSLAIISFRVIPIPRAISESLKPCFRNSKI